MKFKLVKFITLFAKQTLIYYNSGCCVVIRNSLYCYRVCNIISKWISSFLIWNKYQFWKLELYLANETIGHLYAEIWLHIWLCMPLQSEVLMNPIFAPFFCFMTMHHPQKSTSHSRVGFIQLTMCEIKVILITKQSAFMTFKY